MALIKRFKMILLCIPIGIVATLLLCSFAEADIANGKYGVAQVFDVQWNCSVPSLGGSCDYAPHPTEAVQYTMWSFAQPYSDTGQYDIGTGYIQFVATGGNGPHGTPSYKIVLFDQSGNWIRDINDGGEFYALSNDAVFYVSTTNQNGTVVTNSAGYSYGSSLDFTNNLALWPPSSYPANPTILGPGQTSGSSTTTTLTSATNPSTSGASVTFTAIVTGSNPTGTVTFKDGLTTLGTATLSGGSVAYSTSSLSVGTHSITAVYGGDSNNSSSISPALSQVVNEPPVNLGSGISLTFSQASDYNSCSSSSSAGILNTPPGSPPANYRMISLYDISSSCSAFAGPITVTILYDPSSIVGPEADLRLFHWENGTWTDVTVSVDTVNKTITGQVTSLSPFGIGDPLSSSYSTGANTNMIALLAIITISLGILIVRKLREA